MSIEDKLKYLTCVDRSCATGMITGENSIDFFNNLVISDLHILSKNKFHFTALCNPKGRIIATIWLQLNSDGSIEFIYPSNLESILPYLKMRTFRQKLDVSNTNKSVFINDESKSIKVLAKVGTDSEGSKESIDRFYHFIFFLKLPWIDFNNTEKFIPQHVNLDQHENVMNFKKGCYPGQEIIARLKYLGKIKKRMSLFVFETEKEANNNYHENEPVSPIIFNKFNGTYEFQAIKKVTQ